MSAAGQVRRALVQLRHVVAVWIGRLPVRVVCEELIADTSVRLSVRLRANSVALQGPLMTPNRRFTNV